MNVGGTISGIEVLNTQNFEMRRLIVVPEAVSPVVTYCNYLHLCATRQTKQFMRRSTDKTFSIRTLVKTAVPRSLREKRVLFNFCSSPSVAGALQASRLDESHSPNLRRAAYRHALYKATIQTDGF